MAARGAPDGNEPALMRLVLPAGILLLSLLAALVMYFAVEPELRNPAWFLLIGAAAPLYLIPFAGVLSKDAPSVVNQARTGSMAIGGLSMFILVWLIS